MTTSYVAGIVHFGADAGLHACLESLGRQSLLPAAIVVIDHDGQESPPDELAEENPGLVWRAAPNLGFAGGANKVLAFAEERCPSADFVLLLNPDVVLDAEFASSLASEFARHPEAAIGGGKLMRPCGELIDSAGIEMSRSRRFRDRGSEALDQGQYDSVEFVSAVSGAALWLRRESLADLAIGAEIFDEDFFSYHEDTDLAWRARTMGFSVVYVPRARAKHARGWKRAERDRVPVNIRRHSFKNRYLEMIKNDSLGSFLRDLPVILGHEIARLGFALVADRAVLPGYRDALRLSGKAWKKRQAIQKTKYQRSERRTAHGKHIEIDRAGE